MNITKIEVLKNAKKMITNGKVNLFSVTITTKNWLGIEKKFNAYPTNYGPTYGRESILFYIYVDENGKELERKCSQQINNWILISKMNGTLPEDDD